MFTPLIEQSVHQEVLREIVAVHGTPTYVYFEEPIRDRIAALKKHLDGIPFELSFAAKANCALPVLRLMLDEGLGIDAVSPAELDLALRVGFPANKILYSANNMSDDEMISAQQTGVTMNIGELSRLKRFGKTFPGESVCIRLNPQIGAGHHEHVITAGHDSKFGIPVEQIGQVKTIAQECGLTIIGLHQHIGSGILDTEILWSAISVMLQTARSFESLRFINMGGGLGVPYKQEETPLDLGRWQERIVAPLSEYKDTHPSNNLTFEFEPGRFLVAECGVLLVRVNTLKQTARHLFAGVDSGMGHLARPAIYDAYHGIRNLSNPTGPYNTYDVVGNICESADFFARSRAISEIREGDVLAITDVGAYGITMASYYNMRAWPAEIWVPANAGQFETIRGRESPPSLVDRLYPELSRNH